jgi:hypothetical protein
MSKQKEGVDCTEFECNAREGAQTCASRRGARIANKTRSTLKLSAKHHGESDVMAWLPFLRLVVQTPCSNTPPSSMYRARTSSFAKQQCSPTG